MPVANKKRQGTPAFFEDIFERNLRSISAASAAFSGFTFFFFLLLFGFCRFLFRSAFLFHCSFFRPSLGLFLSAHGTALAAASAAAAGAIRRRGRGQPGPAQQAGNAKARQKFFQILGFHKTLLAIACVVEK